MQNFKIFLQVFDDDIPFSIMFDDKYILKFKNTKIHENYIKSIQIHKNPNIDWLMDNNIFNLPENRSTTKFKQVETESG